MSMREQVEREIARMADLPVVSRILVQLNQVAANERAGADDLSRVVIRDQALTVRVLRAVNSSYYRKLDQPAVTTISKAVVLLGFNEVRRLALGMAVFDVLRRGTRLAAGRRIGGRSLLTAIAARHLAGRTQYEPVEEAFVAGLIRDMGKLVLLRCSPDAYAELTERAPDDAWLCRAEKQRFGLHHEQAGRMLARRWDLPAPLCAALGDESGGSPGRAQHARLRELTDVAKIVAAELTEDPGGRSLAAQIAGADAFHGLPVAALRDLAGPVTLDFTEMVESLGVEDVLAPAGEPQADTGSGAKGRLDRALILDRLAEVHAALLAPRPAADPTHLAFDAIHAVLRVPRVLLWVVRDDGRRLQCVADRGWTETCAAHLDAVPVREDAGLLARCLLDRRAVRIADLDVPDLAEVDRDRLVLLRSGQVVLLPLVDRDRPRGVLWLDGGRSRGALDDETVAAAELFGQALTLALSRAVATPVGV